jgi:hypothetical protein
MSAPVILPSQAVDAILLIVEEASKVLDEADSGLVEAHATGTNRHPLASIAGYMMQNHAGKLEWVHEVITQAKQEAQ